MHFLGNKNSTNKFASSKIFSASNFLISQKKLGLLFKPFFFPSHTGLCLVSWVLPPQVSASVDSKYIASTEEVDWVR